ncbi:MAG: hypothetical protein Q8M94_10620 [Ignavibacteria bacterium]|nr:hypothetical protein [Ignavibacteria bacterium]
MKKLYIILSFIIINLPLSAQRLTDRMYVFNLLFNEAENIADGKTSYINSVGGWGEFGAYRLQRDFEHAWYQKLGAFIEFFRTGDYQSFSFVSSMEFIANPDNDIRFKPRSIFWEEGFLYSRKEDSFFWQLGYFHRCKHDVDNFLYGKERALIYGSVQGKIIFLLDFLNEKESALLSARYELYTILQDNRYPKSWMTYSYNWKQLISSLGINFNFTKPISEQYWNYYFNSYSMINFFGRSEGFINRFNSLQKATVNGGFSTGISIKGKAEFRIGLTYEYLSDTGINPYPESAHLLSFGVSVLDHASIK